MKKLKKSTRHIFKIPLKPPNPTNNPRTSTELLHFAILLIRSIEHLHGCGHCPIIGLVVHIATEKHLEVVLVEDRVSHVDIGSADPRGGHMSRWCSMGRRSLSKVKMSRAVTVSSQPGSWVGGHNPPLESELQPVCGQAQKMSFGTSLPTLLLLQRTLIKEEM